MRIIYKPIRNTFNEATSLCFSISFFLSNFWLLYNYHFEYYIITGYSLNITILKPVSFGVITLLCPPGNTYFKKLVPPCPTYQILKKLLLTKLSRRNDAIYRWIYTYGCINVYTCSQTINKYTNEKP